MFIDLFSKNYPSQVCVFIYANKVSPLYVKETGSCYHALFSTLPKGVCNNGEVRLEDGATENEGRVELCYGGEWNTVCHDGVNDRAAMVVCSQLALPMYGE